MDPNVSFKVIAPTKICLKIITPVGLHRYLIFFFTRFY